MEFAEKIFDFIVVGGGPAGCTIAAALANSVQLPAVLLLEAGGRNDQNSLRVDGKRWVTSREENMNWGYKTVPQKYCNGREIDYSRGKGLGGGSAINFAVWAIGARDDYDQWAAEVNDKAFGWEKMQARFKRLENFDGRVNAPENAKYASPNALDHGHDGPLHLGFASVWERDLPPVLDCFEEAGFERNLDHNSGNPLGMALTVNSAYRGRRTTASDLLIDAGKNLNIVTDSPVRRVIMQGNRAIGVETCGAHYFAKKEVILSAGTLDTPKILMHSGIGPATQLRQFNIPITQDIPAIGQGLRDHPSTSLVFKRNPNTNDRNAFYGNKDAMQGAMTQWNEDHTGLWTEHGCQLAAGWFKSDRITSSDEFNALPDSVQNLLHRETVPHYELIVNPTAHFLFPGLSQDYSNISLHMVLMNAQSRGEVRLQSSNPDIPLLFDPKLLEHPFDRRLCIETFRHLLEIIKLPSFSKNNESTLLAPVSESDEDIHNHWKSTGGTLFHMTGTVKMGKPDDSDAAVDHRFRVLGIEGLRVADMSVVPVLPNNHTQTTAFLTGATCAEILLQEYGLAT